MAVYSTHSMSPTPVAQRSFFDDVPVDVVREIMKRLPLSNIPKLALISRRWKVVVNQSKTCEFLLIHHLDQMGLGVNRTHRDLNLARFFKMPRPYRLDPFFWSSLFKHEYMVFSGCYKGHRQALLKKIAMNCIADERRTNKAIQDCLKFNGYRYRVPIQTQLVPYQFSAVREVKKFQVVLYAKKIGPVANPSLTRFYHNLLVNGKEKFEMKECFFRAEEGPHQETPLEPLEELFSLAMGDENLVFVPCFNKEKYVATRIYLKGKKVGQIARKIYGAPLFYNNKLLLLCDRKKPDLYQFKIWDFDRTKITLAKKVGVFIASSALYSLEDLSPEIFKT